jgi:type I restriction enzyme R subunit
MTTFTEADVEQAALEWLAALGWQVAHGPEIAPGTPGAERDALLPKLVSGEIKADGGFLD